MWNHKTLEMDINNTLLEPFKKYTKIGGILFLALGLIGIIFPVFMTFSSVIFVATLMLFAGVSAGGLTWATNKEDWIGWLKSFILIGISLLMFLNPLEGVATLGLLFSIYFFMDAFAGFSLAFSSKGKKHQWLWGLNALSSLVLAIVVLIGFPFTAIWLIGFFIGVSLFFDGIALLFGASLLSEGFYQKVSKVDKEMVEEVQEVEQKLKEKVQKFEKDLDDLDDKIEGKMADKVIEVTDSYHREK